MKALWNGTVLAESDQTIEIEGDLYFPPDAVNREYLVESEHHVASPWLGDASYYTIMVELDENVDAAWYYPEPKDGSIERVGQDFTNYVAFWKGVEVSG